MKLIPRLRRLASSAVHSLTQEFVPGSEPVRVSPTTCEGPRKLEKVRSSEGVVSKDILGALPDVKSPQKRFVALYPLYFYGHVRVFDLSSHPRCLQTTTEAKPD